MKNRNFSKNDKNMNKNFKKANFHSKRWQAKYAEMYKNEDPMKDLKDALSSASEDEILDQIKCQDIESWCDVKVRVADHLNDIETAVTSHSHVQLQNGTLMMSVRSGKRKASVKIGFKVIRSFVHFTFKVMNAYVAFSELLTSLTENFTREMKKMGSEIKFYKNF